MRVLELVRRGWARFESFAYALDYALEYDQCAELRTRVALLEKAVADLEKASR